MNFRPELAAKVMAGEKTVTRRLVSDNPRSPWWRERCSLVVGRDYAVCPGRGKNAIGRVRITHVTRYQLDWIDEADAHREGFESRAVFQAAWCEINGSWNPNDRVWRVEFVAIERVPATTVRFGDFILADGEFRKVYAMQMGDAGTIEAAWEGERGCGGTTLRPDEFITRLRAEGAPRG